MENYTKYYGWITFRWIDLRFAEAKQCGFVAKRLRDLDEKLCGLADE